MLSQVFEVLLALNVIALVLFFFIAATSSRSFCLFVCDDILFARQQQENSLAYYQFMLTSIFDKVFILTYSSVSR